MATGGSVHLEDAYSQSKARVDEFGSVKTSIHGTTGEIANTTNNKLDVNVQGTTGNQLDVESDGSINVNQPNVETTDSGIKKLQVKDLNTNELLREVIYRLDIMNLHLASITDEKFIEGDTK